MYSFFDLIVSHQYAIHKFVLGHINFNKILVLPHEGHQLE